MFFSGGHGVVFDFYNNKELQNIASHVFERGGLIAAVCHGPVALLNLKLSDG
jgi:putative intracellular protease/amidase